jgi:hypothetical protein
VVQEIPLLTRQTQSTLLNHEMSYKRRTSFMNASRLISRLNWATRLIIAGVILSCIGAGLLPSVNGATVTPKSAKGCLEDYTFTKKTSVHEFQLGQFDDVGTCRDDPSQKDIGYQVSSTSVSPTFALELEVAFLEVWYTSESTPGTCSTGVVQGTRSCQVATLVALRTYTTDGSGQLVVGTLYKTSSFSIGAGDLTQPGYDPNSASYVNGSPLVPIGLLGGGVLVLVGGIVVLLLRSVAGRGKRTPQMLTPPGAIPAPGGWPGYPQPLGYAQPAFPPQPGSGPPAAGPQPGYSPPSSPQQVGYPQQGYYQQPGYPQQPGYSPSGYPQQPGSGQWPNQGR